MRRICRMFGELSYCPQPLKRRTVKNARNSAFTIARQPQRAEQSSRAARRAWRFAKRRGHNREKSIARNPRQIHIDTPAFSSLFPSSPAPSPAMSRDRTRTHSLYRGCCAALDVCTCAHVRVCELSHACACASPPPPSRSFPQEGPQESSPLVVEERFLLRSPRRENSAPIPPHLPQLLLLLLPPPPLPLTYDDTRVIASSAITRAACKLTRIGR